MATSFEILLLHEEIRSATGTISRRALETTPETDEFLDKILEPFSRNTFELIGNLNITCRESNFWPWAIVFFETKYRLSGHIYATRRDPNGVRFA